jgi:hypothetical protein
MGSELEAVRILGGFSHSVHRNFFRMERNDEEGTSLLASLLATRAAEQGDSESAVAVIAPEQGPKPSWMRESPSSRSTREVSENSAVELPESLSLLHEMDSLADEDEELSDSTSQSDDVSDGHASRRDYSGLFVLIVIAASAAVGLLVSGAPRAIVASAMIAIGGFSFRLLRSRSGVFLISFGGAAAAMAIVLLFSNFGGCSDSDAVICTQENVQMCDAEQYASAASDFRTRCCLMCKRWGAVGFATNWTLF